MSRENVELVRSVVERSESGILATMKRPARRRADAKVERLSQVQLFSACSKRDLSRIAFLAEEIEVPPGRVLIRQGDPGREAFVIYEGRAKATIRGKGSAKLGPGECFGEMALLHSAPRSATVTAESDMRLLVLGSRQFSTLIEDVPVIGRRVLAALAERLREAERVQPHH
ncbi:MAG TPA: cyclic nucleotide-binding domain-containing protein [Solirubrobacterales bacterium]|jgi:CRP-like cAMP-binding protein|nr:cyclic nucleotide-binding domain-containing protein [Solirubrobacterales bacterium]